MIRGLASVAAIVAMLLTSCAPLGIGETPREPVPYPVGCASFNLSQRRCDYIVAWARLQVHDAERATAVELAPDPGCGAEAGQLCVRSGSVPLVVRFHLPNGTTADQVIYCGVGTGNTLLCTETPEIYLSSPTMNGYRDFPEGATPVPGVDPAAQADAQPLEFERQVIRIEHRGAYEVVLGDAVLPNGILREATFGLADPTTWTVSTTPEGIWLAVESKLADRPPFFNIYEHGWWPGVEPVRVVMQFEVVLFDPGATLDVVNVVVR